MQTETPEQTATEPLDPTPKITEPDRPVLPTEPEDEQPTAAQADEDVLDILEPKSEPKVWEIGPEGDRRQYVQRPLSFIRKMQWFALVGEVLEKALSGPNAMSLNSLMEVPQTRGRTLTMADFADADTFVQAFGKLLTSAPSFLEDSFCMWLDVPDYERDVVKAYMSLPVDTGGLSDDDGLEIIEVFIDQNYEALDTFFGEKVGKLRSRVQARRKAVTESRSSRR